MMIQEVNMKIGDYFERLKYACALGNKKCLDKGAAFSTDRKFERILSSMEFALDKTKNIGSGGLKLSDYLANPVQARDWGENHNTSYLDKTGTRSGKASSDNWESSKNGEFSQKSRKVLVEQKQNGTSMNLYQGDTAEESARLTYQREINQSINLASVKYGLPADLISGVIKAESDFQVNAVSSAGAQGLMQLMPDTAKELGVKDPFDIEQNIDGGVRYLKKMLDLFGNDVKLALAAYNAGPGTVSRYNGNVPYRETVQYVERVLKYSRQAQAQSV